MTAWTSRLDHAVATHFHPGETIPCIKTTIEDDTRATHELFDSEQGGIVPCFTVESEMLDGGHFGKIAATHFHDGAIVPCVRTTIEGHSSALHEVFDTTVGESDPPPTAIVPCVKVATEMLKGGALGEVRIEIDPELASLTVKVGSIVYTLDNGRLERPRS